MFDSSGLLTLHYGKHHTTLIDEIRAWFDGECFADIALVCEGKETLRAHRLILASSSPLIKRVLQETPTAESPVIIQLPGVRAADMRVLLDFLYTGQACVQVFTKVWKALTAFAHWLSLYSVMCNTLRVIADTGKPARLILRYIWHSVRIDSVCTLDRPIFRYMWLSVRIDDICTLDRPIFRYMWQTFC